MIGKHLFVPSKLEYARGSRPDVACILCEVVARRDTVTRLEVHRTKHHVVSLNLHPYNPGHLLVFPRRHICDLDKLEGEEVAALHELTLFCIAVLRERYAPHGFNVGFNLGPASGASIEHLHLHIVPRYERELGFADIIGGVISALHRPLRDAWGDL